MTLRNVQSASVDLVPRRVRPVHADRRAVRGWTYLRATIGTNVSLVAIVVLVGIVLRSMTAIVLSPHVDEPSSLLAARIVAERGFPLLPSGTVYLQGATLSYLLQPFVWAGLGDLEGLRAMRFVLVAAGGLAIVLAFHLGRSLTGDDRVGVACSMLVALDPLSVQWSGLLRMYGLLQPLTIGLALAYVTCLAGPVGVVRSALVVVLFWAAVFTHIGAAVLLPAMGVAALLVFRTAIIREWRTLCVLASCAAAPVTLVGLSSILRSPGEATTSSSSSSPLLFVGNNLLAPLARIQAGIQDWDWTAPFQIGNLSWLVPGLIVGGASIMCARHLLRPTSPATGAWNPIGMVTILAMYWVPVLAVGLFTVAPKERYLLNVHLLGYLFVAIVLVRSLPEAGQQAVQARTWLIRVAHGIALSVLVAGVFWRLDNPVVHPDYNVAMACVTANHRAGQPMIVALPPVAWLAVDEANRDDLVFLAGPQDQKRAQGYTRIDDNGSLIDYWVGIPAIDSVDEFTAVVEQHPDAWIIVDEERLRSAWAYGGEMERVLRDSTNVVVEAPGGAVVLQSRHAERTSGDPDCMAVPSTID